MNVWRANNKKYLRIALYLWRKNNPEKWRAIDTRYREKNRARIRARDALCKARNKHKIDVRRRMIRGNEKWRKAHREDERRYYSIPCNRIRKLLNCAFVRAGKRGLKTDGRLHKKFETSPPKKCACCGICLDYSTGRGNNVRDKSPSMDRVNNSKGYTLTNVSIICMRCNRLKGFASINEMKMILAYAIRQRNHTRHNAH